MILQGLSASNGQYNNMELRFDGTEWQDLGVVMGITTASQEMAINGKDDHVIPIPESFTTSQCACDESSSTSCGSYKK